MFTFQPSVAVVARRSMTQRLIYLRSHTMKRPCSVTNYFDRNCQVPGETEGLSPFYPISFSGFSTIFMLSDIKIFLSTKFIGEMCMQNTQLSMRNVRK